MSNPLRILTWHVHGSYLYYLAHAPHTFYLPVKEGLPHGYGGRCGDRPWPDNLVEVPAEQVKDLELDCVLFQSHKNFLEDQYEILSPAQQRLPRICLEHDPPRQQPTDTRHPVDDPNVLVVHVTHFNQLMWDSGRSPTRVVEHGVVVPKNVRYQGDLNRGLVVINDIVTRGRRLGYDIYERVRRQVPLDLVGMNSEVAGGLGEVSSNCLAEVSSHYRFFFNPIRYSSLPLSVCEAMMIGMPIVALATTEIVVTIPNGEAGYIDTSVDSLISVMRRLIEDPVAARRLGEGARRIALEKHSISRFARDWDATFTDVAGRRRTAKRTMSA